MNTIFWLSITGAVIGWAGFTVDLFYGAKIDFENIERKKVEFNYSRPLWLAVVSTIVALTIWG